MLRKTLKKILADNSGFTLVELLISIFIIAMMSTLFMVNYHSTNKRSELGVVKQKLASDIRLAQNYSLGSKTYDGVTTPKGGWGVHFKGNEKSQYIIFADKNESKSYSSNEAVETKYLPAGVTIDSFSPVQGNGLDIIFYPPDPITYINGLDNTIAQIILRENVNNSTAVISVNFFGLIDTD